MGGEEIESAYMKNSESLMGERNNGYLEGGCLVGIIAHLLIYC